MAADTRRDHGLLQRRRAADLDDVIDAAPIGQLARRLAPFRIGAVIDDMVGAELLRQFKSAGRAADDNHLGRARVLGHRQGRDADRTRALSEEGRVAGTDLGRQEQQELTAESAWINAVRNYKQSLDNFKIQLGLQVDANLVLDDRELEALQIHHPDLSLNDSIKLALASRLDYMSSKDRLEDSERKVKVAQNFLKPQVDLFADASLVNNPAKNYSLPDPQRYAWDAGLNVDPGLDRTSERNSYRAAIIARNQSARTLEEQEDQIKLQVRDSWRTLDQAKRNYEISEIGVHIAERRVEEQSLLAEWGRSKAQDQVDAQNALIDSKNQLTQALVTHTIARLQFWNNMGILYIKPNGQWEEVQNAKTK